MANYAKAMSIMGDTAGNIGHYISQENKDKRDAKLKISERDEGRSYKNSLVAEGRAYVESQSEAKNIREDKESAADRASREKIAGIRSSGAAKVKPLDRLTDKYLKESVEEANKLNKAGKTEEAKEIIIGVDRIREGLGLPAMSTRTQEGVKRWYWANEEDYEVYTRDTASIDKDPADDSGDIIESQPLDMNMFDSGAKKEIDDDRAALNAFKAKEAAGKTKQPVVNPKLSIVENAKAENTPVATAETKKEAGLREDGTKKDAGFLGELPNAKGDISTELSISVNINGKETLIPTIVPGLSVSQLETLLNLEEGEQPPREIVDIAVKHAKKRISQRRSPFFKTGEKTPRDPYDNSRTNEERDKANTGRDAILNTVADVFKYFKPMEGALIYDYIGNPDRSENTDRSQAPYKNQYKQQVNKADTPEKKKALGELRRRYRNGEFTDSGYMKKVREAVK